LAAMKIADPWAKLGAAYALAGDIERASDLFAKSGINGLHASLEGGYLADEVFNALQVRHPQLCATALSSLAIAAAERGQADQARSQYERLAKLQPEQSLWKERAEQLQPGVLAAWNFDTGLGSWGDAKNCDVSVNSGVLNVRATAPDPQFSTRISASAGAKAVVLHYRSGEDFTLQLFWAEGSGGFDDSHHLDYPIPASAGEWNEIALPFWCQKDLNALRLDPNTTSQHPLEINSLVLRTGEPDEYTRAVSKVLIEPELARLSQAITAKPMSAPAYAARATFLARLGRWREAADDFQQECNLGAPDRIKYFKVANCRLLAADIAGHQKLCREMVAKFHETSDPNVADSVCKTCLLGPTEINLSKLPITLLREATNDPNHKNNRHWFVACCALISYREGNHEQAIEWTKELPDLTAQAGALALVVRALAQQQLGQVDQAGASLAQAETFIPRELRGLGAESYAGPLPVLPGSVSHDWLAPEILRREAAKLIRGTAAAQP
jgi:tetratricopeptide (TPR) repeat protein